MSMSPLYALSIASASVSPSPQMPKTLPPAVTMEPSDYAFVPA